MKNETNKTLILGSLNLNQGALECKLHLSVPALSKGEVLQIPVLVIVSRLPGHREGTRGTFGPLSGWAEGLRGNSLQSHRYRLLEENTQGIQRNLNRPQTISAVILLSTLSNHPIGKFCKHPPNLKNGILLRRFPKSFYDQDHVALKF